MSNELVIDESKYKEIKSVTGQTQIELRNSLGIEVGVNELCNHLLTVDGIHAVETLYIGYSSGLKNAEIVKAFPNLQRLFIGGKNIITLDGLEMFKGRFIDIQLEHKRRDIAKISAAPIQSLNLVYKKPDDFTAIGNCRSLNDLSIYKNPSPDMLAWKDVPLSHLRLEGNFTELSNLSFIKTLKIIYVMYCRNFERFTGDNSNIKHIVVQNCRKFDLHSLDTFQNLEYLDITSCAPEISLASLPDLPSLRFLDFLACKVIYDTYELNRKFPKLEVFDPKKITAEQAVFLSKANAGLTVKCNYKDYINGVCVD